MPMSEPSGKKAPAFAVPPVGRITLELKPEQFESLIVKNGISFFQGAGIGLVLNCLNAQARREGEGDTNKPTQIRGETI